jgi:flagellar hook protein FlgE
VGDTYSTSVTAYDSLGESHVLTIDYTKTADNEWSYSITVPSTDVNGTGTTTEVASGTMTFDSSGNLTSPSGTVSDISVTGLADGAADMKLTWNLDGSGSSPIITQEATTSATSATSQDGYTAGTLTSYTVNSDGTVEGEFSNKQTQVLGQVAIASFANEQGLSQVGSSGDYQATAASGQAVVGTAGSGGNGTIKDGEVEESNVSLSSEFAKMIVAQQSYEASAKVLTTLNQVSQATLQVVS